jgi:malate dehydrogenase (oxaloacetate-decarboxylating)
MKKKINYNVEAVKLHKKIKGKISISINEKLTKDNLSLLYTPGVAEPCRIINKNPDASYELTSRWNMIAVISDGSAVLGLGNLGGLAGMPVMEGKCILFKGFGGVDAFPICLNTQDTNQIVNVVKALEPSFGGINLEDISAPRCFEIENRLKEETEIPIFHDDQHGTAVVVLAGLINALKLTKRNKETARIVVNGAGAAAIATSRFLLKYGFKDIILCDTKGILPKEITEHTNSEKLAISRITNPRNIKGALIDALEGADIFIGLSVKGALKPEMIKYMNKDAIIFALANPDPEISPEIAKSCGIKYIATGRSDYANQVNNVLAFPGIMRGALAVRAKDINFEMKLAASQAIANMIPKNKLSEDYFIPKAYNFNIGPKVAVAVAQAAMKTKVNRLTRSLKEIERETINLIKKANK